MSFNVGEIFLNLGIKGAEKTVGALTNVKKGLGETASMSLEAKAGIVAAMYALERLFAISGQAGTSLTNFNALTGISAQNLQKWQFAARQAGVANEELSGSMKAVQGSITNMLLGKGAPEGLAMVANKVGLRPEKMRDTLYVLGQLQKFSQAVPQDVGNVALKSFGLSEGMISAMRRNAFTPDMLKRAPTYSDKEIAALDKANIAWSNLGVKIEMAIGKFNAAHGGQLVTDISKIVDGVIALTEALVKLGESLKVFKLVGMAFSGWSQILKIDKGIVDSKGGSVLEFFKEMPGVLKEMGKDIIAPSVSPVQKPGAQNVQINQNLNFHHDGQDHSKNADSHKKAMKDAYRQIPAQVQGS